MCILECLLNWKTGHKVLRFSAFQIVLHLADAFIQSDLHCMKVIQFFSSCIPNCDLSIASARYTKVTDMNPRKCMFSDKLHTLNTIQVALDTSICQTHECKCFYMSLKYQLGFSACHSE